MVYDCLIFLWNNVFGIIMAKLHPQKERCKIGSFKMDSGSVGVNNSIKPLYSYWINVFGNTQETP